MKLGFIGGGNMATALIGGLQRPLDLLVVERDAARRALLEQQYGVRTAPDLVPELGECELLVLAVKPTDMQAVCTGLAAIAGAPLLLSVAAGIPSSALARWSQRAAVVRAMPNTPALIGQGMTGLFASARVSDAQRAQVDTVLAGIGPSVWFADEAMLDAVTAISGSGPAYVFYFIEALQSAAIQMGMDAAQARAFAVQTFVGAAQLAAASSDDVATLRERVTSKGGTTAAALEHLRTAGVGPAITAACFAALERSREMGRTLGD